LSPRLSGRSVAVAYNRCGVFREISMNFFLKWSCWLVCASSAFVNGAAAGAAPAGKEANGRPVRIVNPRLLAGDNIAAVRVPLGIPNDYKRQYTHRSRALDTAQDKGQTLNCKRPRNAFRRARERKSGTITASSILITSSVFVAGLEQRVELASGAPRLAQPERQKTAAHQAPARSRWSLGSSPVLEWPVRWRRFSG